MPTALITGVGTMKSIGAGIARKLAEKGWDLAVTHWDAYDARMERSSGAAGLLAGQLRTLGVQIHDFEVDLSLPSGPSELFNWCSTYIGPVDALILSHCESVPSWLLETTDESLERHFEVNVFASWRLIRSFALQAPQAGGSIVALTSDDVIGNVPYGASKAALDRIVLSCARELADQKIRANLINPGPIDTGWMNDEVRESLRRRQPGGFLGTPANCADLVAFLLSSEGAWINGQLLKSDGGFSV